MDKKRQTAYKCCLGELAKGKYVKGEGLEPGYVVTDLGRRVSRVRTLATVVNKFINEEKSYGFLVLDDSTDTLRVKIWQNIKMIEPFEVGDIVDVVGKIREYDGELYIMPEIVLKVDADWEVLRKAELADIWSQQRQKMDLIRDTMKSIADVEELKVYVSERHGIDAEESVAILETLSQKSDTQPLESKDHREKVLKAIETLGTKDGADIGMIIDEVKLDENMIDAVLNELLDNGTIYEPRPGKFKKL